MKHPSRLAHHVRTANAVLALLDAASHQRDAGNRATMRDLARDAVALATHFDKGRPRQLPLAI